MVQNERFRGRKKENRHNGETHRRNGGTQIEKGSFDTHRRNGGTLPSQRWGGDQHAFALEIYAIGARLQFITLDTWSI